MAGSVGLARVKKPGASISLSKHPTVAASAKPYNPGRNPNVGHDTPRIKPINTRIYAKEAGARGEDPSKFQHSGFYMPGENKDGF